MELEIINKLYLELSQITTARNSREIALVDALTEIAEDKLRSGDAIWMRDVAKDALAKVKL